MILSKCVNFEELISFLHLDYANNLYFFTYLNEKAIDANADFLVAKRAGRIVLALMLTPIHCCLSCSDPGVLSAIAEQLPVITSLHIVGRKDLHEALLKISRGPERNAGIYTFSEHSLTRLPDALKGSSQKASLADLDALVQYYEHNDMLFDARNRLPAILSWGSIYLKQMNHEILSCALTTTETDKAAMIGAVYTPPEYRSRGYAKNCIVDLCSELIAKNKKPYLFYKKDDLLLQRLYALLGFRPIDTWLLATRK